MNIDLKSFNKDFYKNICKADLESVKRTIEISQSKCHIEITTLVIPDLNDSISEIKELAKWVYSISKEIPLHFTRFFPRYKMKNVFPTNIGKLKILQNTAKEYLNNVFLGNV